MIEAGSVSCEITGSQSDKPWVRMASSGEREGEGGRRKEREGGREGERESEQASACMSMLHYLEVVNDYLFRTVGLVGLCNFVGILFKLLLLRIC